MRERRLSLSLADFIMVLDCEIKKEVNQHGFSRISGYIRSDDEDNLIYGAGNNTFAKLEAEDDDGQKQVLFAGLVESIRIEDVDGLKKATVILTGGTRLLAGPERTRTFQDTALTYDQILKTVEQSYEGAVHRMSTGNGEVIGDMVVQYRENDWDFVKRLASHFNGVIIPYFQNMGIRYNFGLPHGAFKEAAKVLHYTLKNDIDELMSKQEQGIEEVKNQDALSFQINSREIYDLGEGISFMGYQLYIHSVNSQMVKGELIHSYRLKPTSGFRVPKIYNHKLTGASLDGIILDTSRNMVKIQVKADNKQDKAKAKWLPYSTVYSSADGSGWYCMPEKNDRVRLYFPNEKEKEGYVISSIHQDMDANGQVTSQAPRSNPDNKSISTKYNKQIELTPTAITMTNHKGMSVILDDNEGISIISDKDIVIQSKEGLTIKSQRESMVVEAADAIELIQGNTTMTLKDDVTVKGGMFKVE